MYKVPVLSKHTLLRELTFQLKKNKGNIKEQTLKTRTKPLHNQDILCFYLTNDFLLEVQCCRKFAHSIRRF